MYCLDFLGHNNARFLSVSLFDISESCNLFRLRSEIFKMLNNIELHDVLAKIQLVNVF